VRFILTAIKQFFCLYSLNDKYNFTPNGTDSAVKPGISTTPSKLIKVARRTENRQVRGLSSAKWDALFTADIFISASDNDHISSGEREQS
jgi:hypothetical protein